MPCGTSVLEVWHADCGGTLLYSISIGEFGQPSIGSIPLGDFEPGSYLPLQ